MIRRGFLASLLALVGSSATARWDGRQPSAESEPHEVIFRFDGEEWSHNADSLAGAEGYVRATAEAFGEHASGLAYEIKPFRVGQRDRLIQYLRRDCPTD